MPDNLVFAGTPAFGLLSLRALVDAGMVPRLVLTQPDRPAGRGRKPAASPVKQYAAEQGIPFRQPQSLNEESIVAELLDLRPATIVVAAYGLIFPTDILALPRCGCVNVHASLLPRWRGAAPVQAAILHGDAGTGISLMRMEKGLDSGPVYAAEPLALTAIETAGSLHDRLASLGAVMLVRHLPRILAGGLEPLPQDDQLATYAGKIDKNDARLDFNLPAQQLERRVRAYNPHPGAWFIMGGERVKCWKAATADSAARAVPAGTVVAAGRGGIDVACKDGVIRLLELQRPGRGRISAAEFAAQNASPGTLLPA